MASTPRSSSAIPLWSKAPTARATAATGWGPSEDLVGRIRSVTTLAAPHFGTCLAESPLARLASGHPSLGALRDLVSATLDVTRRGDLASRIRFAMSATPGLTKMPWFMIQMMIMNELARDLHPGVLGALSARPLRPECVGRVVSVATIAPRPGSGHPDKLFRDMWRWTHHGSPGAPASASAAVSSDFSLRLPSQRAILLPPLDGGDNDGIVSTERQIFGELIGLVVGDHVDVLGRYRRSSLVDGKVIDPGLLTSGAEFGDDEFFGLLLRLGERVAHFVQSDG